ncbi:hypothetical protein [Streptomyces sp. 3211]|nr:hypothetical protein [Streptomyces sp. 3211]
MSGTRAGAYGGAVAHLLLDRRDGLGLIACSTRGLHGFTFLPPPTA